TRPSLFASPTTTSSSTRGPSSPTRSSRSPTRSAPPWMPEGKHRAVFLDRDGTIVDDPPPGFLHEPGKVRLLPGAAAAIRRLNQTGWLVVIVTNQSGIGRGLYVEAEARGTTVVPDLSAAVDRIVQAE